MARLTVLDAAGREVGSAVATDPRSGDLTVRIDRATPGATYFIRVAKARDDVFGIGAYRLSVGTTTADGPARPGAKALGGAKTVSNTVNLGTQKEGTDRRWDFTARTALSNPSETDTYTVRTRRTTPGTLVVAVWGLQPGGLDPTAAVFDRACNLPGPG